MGKKAKRRQAATMRQMQGMAEEQWEYWKGEQAEQEIDVAAQRRQYEAFDFTNPYAGAQNAFADIQTQFGNIYAGAENVYAGAQNQFAGMENLYEGMENRFEDMTVDMRAAEFQRQQTQQQQANIMQGLRGAAGTSGVAGLAQAMAGQGALQAQQISAGISQQERQNQMLAAQEGARIDQLQRGAGMQLQQMEAQGAMQTQQLQMAGAAQQQQMILGGAAQAQQLGVSQQNVQAQGQWAAEMARMQGEAMVQSAEFGRESTLLGMEYGLLSGANQGLSQSMANQMSAMGMQANMYGAQAQSGASTFGTAMMVGAKIFTMSCLPKGVYIDTLEAKKLIEDINPGDIVVGYSGEPVTVLQKHCYKEDPKNTFYNIKMDYEDETRSFSIGAWHRILGTLTTDIEENVISKEKYTGVEFSYDLLTEDLGYRMDGVPVNSMIDEMAELGIKLKNK